MLDRKQIYHTLNTICDWGKTLEKSDYWYVWARFFERPIDQQEKAIERINALPSLPPEITKTFTPWDPTITNLASLSRELLLSVEDYLTNWEANGLGKLICGRHYDFVRVLRAMAEFYSGNAPSEHCNSNFIDFFIACQDEE